MRKRTIPALALAVGLLQASLLAALARAQAAPSSQSPSAASYCSDSNITRIRAMPPFTLIRKDVMERKLPDGTMFRQERLTKEARDSQGRHYVEMRIPSSLSSENPIFDDVTVRVEDPVGNAWIGWDVDKREATITHFKPRANPRPRVPAPEGGGRSFSVSLRMIGKDGKPIETQPHNENLGMKLVSGTEACGNRFTETFPPGSRMNDKPVTVVRESWFSPELGIQVKSVVEDPGFGVNTREILGLDRGEPDPSLFRVPEGYRVKQNLMESPF